MTRTPRTESSQARARARQRFDYYMFFDCGDEVGGRILFLPFAFSFFAPLSVYVRRRTDDGSKKGTGAICCASSCGWLASASIMACQWNGGVEGGPTSRPGSTCLVPRFSLRRDLVRRSRIAEQRRTVNHPRPVNPIKNNGQFTSEWFFYGMSPGEAGQGKKQSRDGRRKARRATHG